MAKGKSRKKSPKKEETGILYSDNVAHKLTEADAGRRQQCVEEAIGFINSGITIKEHYCMVIASKPEVVCSKIGPLPLNYVSLKNIARKLSREHFENRRKNAERIKRCLAGPLYIGSDTKPYIGGSDTISNIEESDIGESHIDNRRAPQTATGPSQSLAKNDKATQFYPRTYMDDQIGVNDTDPENLVQYFKPQTTITPTTRPKGISIFPSKREEKVLRRNVNLDIINPGQVRVNYYKIETDQRLVVYKVHFFPEEYKMYHKHILELLKERCFRGQSLFFDDNITGYSLEPLFPDRFRDIEVQFSINDVKMLARVKLKRVGTVSLGYLNKGKKNPIALKKVRRGFQALVSHVLELNSYRVKKFKMVNEEDDKLLPVHTDFGMQLWPSLKINLVETYEPLQLCCYLHYQHTTDRIGVVDMMYGFLRQLNEFLFYGDMEHPLDSKYIPKLEAFLQAYCVEFDIIKDHIPDKARFYNVQRLSNPASELFLEDKGGVFGKKDSIIPMTTAFEKISCPLLYPHLPTVVSVGHDSVAYKFPPETLYMVEQQLFRRKLNRGEKTTIFKTLILYDRLEKNVWKALAIKQEMFKQLQANGITVAPTETKMESGICPPPKLVYSNKQVYPVHGMWGFNRFYKPAYIKNWVIIGFIENSYRDELKRLSTMIEGTAQVMDLRIMSKPIKIMIEPFDASRTHKKVISVVQEYAYCDLILAVVPDKGALRSYILTVAEVFHGCVMVCISLNTLISITLESTGKLTYQQTVILMTLLNGLNAKLNGTNFYIENFQQHFSVPNSKFMLVGTDFYKPAKNDPIPNVASMTASFDAYGMAYNGCWRFQQTSPFIEELKEMFKEQLLYYYEKNGQKPDSIIYFRDGIASKNFNHVRHHTLKSIRLACAMFNDYHPKITIIIVQKRHTTRNVTGDIEDSSGYYFVIENTSSHFPEFFLHSHCDINTPMVKPTKYIVLHNDNDAHLPTLVHHICHLYSKCNVTLSYPAPLFYAYKLTKRVKLHYKQIYFFSKLEHITYDHQDTLCKPDRPFVRGYPMYYIQ